MTDPGAPTKKIRSTRSITAEDTYTLSFSGGKRYRFEFYRDRKGNLSKVPKIRINPDKWRVIETIPEDWTKLEIPNDVSWAYKSISTDKEIATYSHESKRADVSEDYKNNLDLLVIKLQDSYVIYQKLHQRKEKMNYELQIRGANEEYVWIRSLSPAIGLVLFLLIYAGAF